MMISTIKLYFEDGDTTTTQVGAGKEWIVKYYTDNNKMDSCYNLGKQVTRIDIIDSPILKEYHPLCGGVVYFFKKIDGVYLWEV